MKYLIYFLIFTSGLIFHKICNEIYDYQWIKAFNSSVCQNIYKKALNDENNMQPLSTRFRCTEKEMGSYYYLTYILIRPMYSLKNGKWGF